MGSPLVSSAPQRTQTHRGLVTVAATILSRLPCREKRLALAGCRCARRCPTPETAASGAPGENAGSAEAILVVTIRRPKAVMSDDEQTRGDVVHAPRELVVPAALQGARLDKAIAELLPELSRARVKRAVDLGAVRVNGRRLAKGATVHEGDLLRVDVAQVADVPAVPSPGAPLRVLLETPTIAVVDKPAGQPTAPLRPGEVGTLVNAVLGRYPELVPADNASFIGHSAREPGIIHRLDTETSGAVVVARTAASFEVLKVALREGRLQKSYLLVCAEQGLPDAGTIEFPLANHPKDQRRVYACVHPRDVMRYEPRLAATRYRVLRRTGAWALVEAHVDKALRHQLRAHFAAVGHPLAGDELYGGHVIRALGRHALHASRVTFAGEGPVEAFDVSVPLPKDIAALLDSGSEQPSDDTTA
jgi:23S rRNA pseudouridine1911/1915/1917 synthase